MDEHIVNNIFNIAGGFEQSNLATVKKIIMEYNRTDSIMEVANLNYLDCLDFSYSRQGQDVRYALNDDKLRNLGWEPKKQFDQELPYIIEYYKEKFIW